MAIRTRAQAGLTGDPVVDRYRRKADQCWDLAGLARRDGDLAAAASYTEEARKYEAIWREARGQ